jgi:hypothetical protein
MSEFEDAIEHVFFFRACPISDVHENLPIAMNSA